MQPSEYILCFVYFKTFEAPITTSADDSLEYFVIVFPDKIMLDISCESSAWQRIHMKHQALFSSKGKSENNKSVVCCNIGWCFKGYIHCRSIKATNSNLHIGASHRKQLAPVSIQDKLSLPVISAIGRLFMWPMILL